MSLGCRQHEDLESGCALCAALAVVPGKYADRQHTTASTTVAMRNQESGQPNLPPSVSMTRNSSQLNARYASIQ